MNMLGKIGTVFTHKKDEATKKKVIQRFEDFIHLFEQEIEKAPKKHLVIDAKSNLVSLILTTMVELLSDGFVPPKKTSGELSSGRVFTFFDIYARELQTDMFSFIKNYIQFQTDNERACAWLILELNNKTLATTLQLVTSHRKIMQCYEKDASIVILQEPIIASVKQLDSLNYSIEGQAIQSYRDYLNYRFNENNDLEKEFGDLKSEESDGDTKQKAKPNAIGSNNSNTNPSGDASKQGAYLDLDSVRKNILRVQGLVDDEKKGDVSKPTQPNNHKPAEQPEEKIELSAFREKLKAKQQQQINASAENHGQEETKGGGAGQTEEASQKKNSSFSRVSLGAFTKSGINLKDIYAKGLRAKIMNPPSRKGTSDSQDFYKMDLDKKLKGKKIKNSERLYLERFKNEEELYAYKPQPTDQPDPAKQDYKCYTCSAPLSKFMLFFNKSYGYCDYTGHYFCYNCTSTEKKVIPWRVIKDFNFKKHSVSKVADEELQKYYTKFNIAIKPEEDVVQKNKIVYDTLVKKRELHLIFDMICETFYVLDIIPNRYNLVLRKNLFSLKNFQEINEGTMLQVIERSITLSRKHILGCKDCLKKGKICKICSDPDKIFFFDIANTSFCKKCKRFYHTRCLQLKGCIACSHDS